MKYSGASRRVLHVKNTRLTRPMRWELDVPFWPGEDTWRDNSTRMTPGA
jgi:hypothetical protein